MKVLLVNGSPHEKGCTYTALKEIANTLENNDIETDFLWLGIEPLAGCIGCNACLKTGKCFRNDIVNDFLNKVPDIDGFVFGSPVHFASSSGALTSFMDRAFYGRRKLFENKPACCICSCRRGGASATFDQINKYFSMNNMPIVTSQYWNQVHGTTPDEVKRDLEGMQTMRVLGRNMAWLLKCIDLGKKNNINRPDLEDRETTNFIR